MKLATSADRPGHDVVIPARLASALEASGPNFRTFRCAEFDTAITTPDVGWSVPFDSMQSPSTVLADFDGDGRMDVAVLQHSKNEIRFVVTLDRNPIPEVLELERWPHSVTERPEPLQQFLTRTAAGPIDIPNWDTGERDTTLQLAHGGVAIGVWEKASDLYYFTNGHFHSVTTSD